MGGMQELVTQRQHPIQGAIAGYVCGAIVWGRAKSAVSYQICLYLLSRNIVGAIQHQVHQGRLTSRNGFRQFAAITWAVVMYLFELDTSCLQESLASSMTFLYHDSDNWADWRDFVPFALPASAESWPVPAKFADLVKGGPAALRS